MKYYLKKVLLFWLLGCSLALYGQNQPPVAMLSADVVVGTAPLTVNFSTIGTHDPDGNIIFHAMTYGDGNGTGAVFSPTVPLNYSHTYDIPGIYQADLSVGDIFNQGGQAVVTIYVQAPIGTYDIPIKTNTDAHLSSLGNFVNDPTLQVGNASPSYDAFLKFNPSFNSNVTNCGTVNNLKLQLVTESITAQTADVQVYLSSSNSWTESAPGDLVSIATFTLLDQVSQTYSLGDTVIWDLGINMTSELTLKVSTNTLLANINFGASEYFFPESHPCLLVEMDNTAGLCQFPIKVSPRIILGGPFKVTVNALMDDDLRVQGLIPMTDPYGFGVTRGANTADNFGDQSIVDWVVVQLRDQTDPTIILKEVPALVRRDGYVVSPENITEEVMIENTAFDHYYLAIKHRNHLGMMTANPIALNNTPVVVDFAILSNPSYTPTWGTNAQDTDGVDYTMMYAGNVNTSNNSHPVGVNSIRGAGPVYINDVSQVVNFLGRFSNVVYNVYRDEDVHMRGTVRAAGPIYINDVTRIIQTLGSFSSILYEQLPEHGNPGN